MSGKSSSKKFENNLVRTGSGQVVMSSGHNTTSEKSKVDFIYGAVPSRSKNDILLVLQSCDYNVDAAISVFSQGQAEEVLNQWSYKGKRSKDGNKKKRSKKKPANKESNEFDISKQDDKKYSVTNHVLNGTGSQPPTTLSLDLPSSSENPSTLELNGILSHDSVTPTKSPQDEKSSQPLKPQPSAHGHSVSHPKHHKSHPSKSEKLSPTSNTDALKRTTKDLTRSSFSLARYQVVLEEECDQSLKRLNKTFENIKNCIREREESLIQTLKEFKEQADKMLQQRSEDAAALKLKTERVNSLSDEQVALLRADIKSFVAERKFDEELAETKRFVCDEEQLIKEIKAFGQVVPIKNTYTPVVLNHPVPTATAKSTSTNIIPKAITTSSPPSYKTTIPPDNKSSTDPKTASVTSKTSAPTQATDSDHVKSALANQESTINVQAAPVVSKEFDAQHKSNKTNIDKQPARKGAKPSTSKLGSATGPPPNISTLISLAMAKSSAATVSDSVNEHLQGASSMDEQKSGGERKLPQDSARNPQNRPNTATVQHDKQKKPREPRPKRPQTNRQPRQNQGAQQDKLTASQQVKEAGKAGQGQAESSKPKPKQGNQSEQTQEGARRRQRRRSGRDRKPRASEDSDVTKDKTVSSRQENTKEGNIDGLPEDVANSGENAQSSIEGGIVDIKSPDGVLPQRSPRSQTRQRRKNTVEKTEQVKMQEVNLSTNGLDHSGKNEKESPAKESPVMDFPVIQPPVEESPAKESPVKDFLVIQPPVEESPAKESLVEKSLAKESPVEESPAKESLVEKSIAKESPVEESPVEESPVEESPVEESPVKEQEQEDIVGPKIAQVVAPALINGHEVSEEESKPIQHSQINEYEATNGTSDDCLVER